MEDRMYVRLGYNFDEERHDYMELCNHIKLYAYRDDNIEMAEYVVHLDMYCSVCGDYHHLNVLI